MRRIFGLIISIAFLSCGLGESATSKPGFIKDSLLGSWTNDTSGTIKMEIREADIYYPWMPAKFPYKIVGDTIELTRVDGTYIGPINWSAKAVLKNDTLLIFERHGVEKYWRVKSNKQRTTSDL
jgi:hypothetical protein